LPKSRTILFLISILFFLNSSAEKSSGFCYIKDAVNGEAIITVQPYTYFETQIVSSGWVRILLKAWVRKIDVYDRIQVKVKSKLFDNNGKFIAKVLIGFNPMRTLDENDTAYYIAISAFMENACIDKSSVPETELSNLLMGLSVNAQLDTFYSHIKNFNYEFWLEEGNYTSYLIYEPDFVSQTERPRILMIFFNNELISIFHTREIKVKIYDSIEMGSQYKMIYNSKFKENTKEHMMKIYKSKISSFD